MAPSACPPLKPTGMLSRRPQHRVSATKLHGPDVGLSWSEVHEPTKGVVAASEIASGAQLMAQV
jgi:hypothetical protein